MEKKKIMLASIVSILCIAIGITYAIFAYSRTGKNSELIVGDIYMRYSEDKQLSLQDAVPSVNPPTGNYFEFTIEGRNTTVDKDIWYEVVLNRGDVPTNKNEINRIQDRFLKFRLVEVTNNVEGEHLVDDLSYEDIRNKRIYVATIPHGGANSSVVSHTYRLYMWIGEEVGIGTNADYTSEEWSNLFASVVVNVTGDFNKKSINNAPVNNCTFEPAASDVYTEVVSYGGINKTACMNYIINAWWDGDMEEYELYESPEWKIFYDDLCTTGSAINPDFHDEVNLNDCFLSNFNLSGNQLASLGIITDAVYETKLKQGTEYVDNQYTYHYMESGAPSVNYYNSVYWIEYVAWSGVLNGPEGWGVLLTDPSSTDKIDTPLCTSINGKPLLYMDGTFALSQATEIDLSSFNTSDVISMSTMFMESQATELDLSTFDTSNVENMRYMFYNSNATSIDLSSFDTSNVEDMNSMFYNSKVTNLDLSSFDTRKVNNIYGMFSRSQVSRIYASDRWVISNQISSSTSVFDNCNNLVGGSNTAWSSSNTSVEYARVDNPPAAPGYFTYKTAPSS